MRKTIFAISLAVGMIEPLHAQQQPFSANAALVSDYRYRGISQSRLGPALQGGADYADGANGMYAGTWLSTIRWTRDAGGGGDAEWDLYAGRRGQLSADISYDAGMLAYVYPGNGLGNVAGLSNANTVEAYGQLGYGPAYAKYSLALTNLFGFVDSHRSGYLDLGANIDLGGDLALNLHAGHQQVHGHGEAAYSDWKAGLSKTWGSATGSLALVATNANRTAYAAPTNGKFLGATALVVSVSVSF